MPDDAREPQPPFGSIERMAIELSIPEWQTVTQVLSLAPYVRVFKVLGEIERQAKALDAMRARAQAERAAEAVRRDVDHWRLEAASAGRRADAAAKRAEDAERKLRAIKRARGEKKNEEGETADAPGEDIPQGEPD